jgi:iduronate 2-sulfatase
MKSGKILKAILFFIAIQPNLCPASEQEKKNVLLICVDDLKPNIGAYGDPLARTPNLDKLAARSLVFENAFCNQAVCSPSRNSLLTALRPQTLGIYDLGTNFRKSRPNAVTFPQLFKNHGYHTEAMGKIFHVGHGNNEDKASWSVPHFSAKTIGYALKENLAPTREGAMFENKNPSNLPRGAAYESADVPDNTYGDGKVAEEAIRRLQSAAAKPDQPFFMAVGFLKPHLPFCAPKKYWDMHDPAKFELASMKSAPEGAPDFAATNWGELRNYKNMPEKGPVDDQTARTLIHGYYAATSYMDAQLGRVLESLESTGLAKNTIVVLWGDHGWHLGDHGMWCKHTNYEQAARIPVMIHLPGVSEGTRTKSFLETVDIYPTVAELAGLNVPEGLDGISQAKVIHDPKMAIRDSIIHVYPRGGGLLGRAIRNERYRLVEWKKIGASADQAQYELYDYLKDPMETRNLAESQKEAVNSLKAVLATHPEAKPQIKNQQPATKQQQKGNEKAKTDRTTMFQRRDKNGDGMLTREEFLLNQPDPDKAPARFPKFDTNGDGQLSLSEFLSQGKS